MKHCLFLCCCLLSLAIHAQFTCCNLGVPDCLLTHPIHDIQIVSLDRNNNPIYLSFSVEYNWEYDIHECYSSIGRFNCYIYGFEWHMWWGGDQLIYPTKDNDIPSLDGTGQFYGVPYDFEYPDIITINEVRFCIMIDGAQYGPLENYQEFELGIENRLYPGRTYYTFPSGYNSYFDVFYQDGQPKLIAGLITPLGFDQNFPQYGDLDFDNHVDINDMTSLIDLLLGDDINYIDKCGPADVDGDGNVTIADVSTLIDILMTAD